MSGYLAIGHGVKPTGTFDPGAVNGPVWEHTLGYVVTLVATAALRRSGVEVISEAELPFNTDPNFTGSVARARAARCEWGVEIHFDWSGAPAGTFVLYDQPTGEELARNIRNAFRWLGAPVRPNSYRPELAFLRGLSIPSVSVEVGPVGPRTLPELSTAGELIAIGICGWKGARYQGPS